MAAVVQARVLCVSRARCSRLSYFPSADSSAPTPRVQTQEDAAKNGTRPPYTLWGSVRGVIAEAATPTDFDASDADGNLLWPGFPPVIFVRMEVRSPPCVL